MFLRRRIANEKCKQIKKSGKYQYKVSITKGLFFLSDFLLYHTPISGIIDHYCIIVNFYKVGKKQEQIKNNIP